MVLIWIFGIILFGSAVVYKSWTPAQMVETFGKKWGARVPGIVVGSMLLLFASVITLCFFPKNSISADEHTVQKVFASTATVSYDKNTGLVKVTPKGSSSLSGGEYDIYTEADSNRASVVEKKFDNLSTHINTATGVELADPDDGSVVYSSINGSGTTDN
jgi:hypothetical protein